MKVSCCWLQQECIGGAYIVLWLGMRVYCGASVVFVVHVRRCALFRAVALVVSAAETHGCNMGRKTGMFVWFCYFLMCFVDAIPYTFCVH